MGCYYCFGPKRGCCRGTKDGVITVFARKWINIPSFCPKIVITTLFMPSNNKNVQMYYFLEATKGTLLCGCTKVGIFIVWWAHRCHY